MVKDKDTDKKVIRTTRATITIRTTRMISSNDLTKQMKANKR